MDVRRQVWRSRWAAVGAAVAVTLGAGGIGITHATLGSGERTAFVPITPCRLIDTRPAPDNRGPRLGPLGPDSTFTITATGSTVGDCTITSQATGLVLNVTALNQSRPTFLTIYPSGASRPLTSNLNPTPGQPATPNAVTVDLNPTGQFDIYNLSGNVDVIVDVVGYYEDHHHDDRYYTKGQVDAQFAAKANSADVYTKGEVDAAIAAKPVVLTEPAGRFDRLGTTPTAFSNLGHLLVTSSDGSIVMGLGAPTSIGGTQYQLSAVEWCLNSNATNSAFVTSAVVLHDMAGAPASPVAAAVRDDTDRSTAGCYTLTVPPLSPRGYSLALGLSGTPISTSNSLIFSSVRTTWIPVL